MNGPMALANIPIYRLKVKTEASFAADDPWNGDRSTTFTIDDYVRSEHRQVSPDYEPPGRDFERVLRSGIDGVERILPDSLSELWRTQRVPPASLPRLLKVLEPRLEPGDYPVMIKNKVRTFLAWLLAFIYVLTLALTVPDTVQGAMSPWLAAPVLLVMTLFCGGLYYAVIARTMRRRKSQMAWILKQAAKPA